MSSQTCISTNMLKFVLFLVVVRLLLLSATCESASVVVKRGQVKLCGRRLIETLSMLCEGRYYDPEDNEISKRRMLYNNNMPNQQDKDYFNPPWYVSVPAAPRPPVPFGLPRHHPMMMMMDGVRQRRGVVDECCTQACSPSVLLSYCGPIIQ